MQKKLFSLGLMIHGPLGFLNLHCYRCLLRNPAAWHVASVHTLLVVSWDHPGKQWVCLELQQSPPSEMSSSSWDGRVGFKREGILHEKQCANPTFSIALQHHKPLNPSWIDQAPEFYGTTRAQTLVQSYHKNRSKAENQWLWYHCYDLRWNRTTEQGNKNRNHTHRTIFGNFLGDLSVFLLFYIYLARIYGS